MYNSYFGFSEAPFENKLDQKFLFLGEDHSEVLAALLYFIRESKGFAVVCGDVGTGKTMLINCFLERLPENVHPILILNPNVTYHELLYYIGKELQLQEIKNNILELTDDIKEALINNRKQGKVYVLIVDEAHLLPNSSLEDIRLLSNIETREQKLLQILLVGQYELSHKLDRPDMRQLRQRINISRFLSPLNPGETVQYIDYRLSRAGSDFDSCFEPRTKSLIYKMTEGVPRKINQICDSALLICMTEKRPKVNPAILRKAREALHADQMFTPRAASKGRFRFPDFRKAVVPAVCAGLLILGFALGQKGFFGRSANLLLNPSSVSAQGRTDINHENLPETRAVLTPPKGGSAPAQTTAENQVAALSQAPPAVQPDRELVPASNFEASASGPAEPMAPPLPLTRNAPAAAVLAARSVQEAPEGSALSGLQEKPASQNQPAAQPEPSNPSKSPAATTSKDLTSARHNNGQAPRKIVIQPGDSLSKIALRWYPENLELGLEAIILANLKNSKEDLIHPGQVLFLPEINFSNKTLKLRDDLYYSPLGHFRSFNTLQETMSNLNRYKVRYLIINSIDTTGATVHRVILGGYERVGDLENALKSLQNNTSKG